MAKKEDLIDWLIEALKEQNGSSSIANVCKYIWNNYGMMGTS